MSDTVTQLQYNKLFDFDTIPKTTTQPGVPPYVITSVTLRTLINKFLQERKDKKEVKKRESE